jgi:hypothetical protein
MRYAKGHIPRAKSSGIPAAFLANTVAANLGFLSLAGFQSWIVFVTTVLSYAYPQLTPRGRQKKESYRSERENIMVKYSFRVVDHPKPETKGATMSRISEYRVSPTHSFAKRIGVESVPTAIKQQVRRRLFNTNFSSQSVMT